MSAVLPYYLAVHRDCIPARLLLTWGESSLWDCGRKKQVFGEPGFEGEILVDRGKNEQVSSGEFSASPRERWLGGL